MNLLSIKYFIAIADEGSISAAARNLFISQQTLSEHLKKLEDELGTPLITRGRPLTLTPAGEYFLTSGKEILSVYDRILTDVDDITHQRRSRITVAIPTFYTPPYLAQILLRYQTKHPEYEVSVIKRQHIDVIHRMDGVDLYFSALPLAPELKNHILLENDPYCVVFQRSLAERVYGDAWEAVEERLILEQNLSAIREMPFLVMKDRYGRTPESLQRLFTEHGFEPNAILQSESQSILDQFCLAGQGCLLATESYIRYGILCRDTPQTRDLLYYPLQVNSFAVKLAISHAANKHLHAAEQCFIREAMDFFNESSCDP